MLCQTVKMPFAGSFQTWKDAPKLVHNPLGIECSSDALIIVVTSSRMWIGSCLAIPTPTAKSVTREARAHCQIPCSLRYLPLVSENEASSKVVDSMARLSMSNKMY